MQTVDRFDLRTVAFLGKSSESLNLNPYLISAKVQSASLAVPVGHHILHIIQVPEERGHGPVEHSLKGRGAFHASLQRRSVVREERHSSRDYW